MGLVANKTSLTEIKICEVCGNEVLKNLLNLGDHPLCDDLVHTNETRECIEYPIEILYCDTCFTAHQRFQVPKTDLFPKTYHYRSRFTADVLNGMSALVDATSSAFDNDLKDKVVLDIGCNDGSLLDFFQTKGAKTIGVEPTNAYIDALNRGHEIYNNYFSLETANEIKKQHGLPNIITFTNVFAHIEDLTSLIESLKILISSDTLIVIENHYLGAVLDKFQFDTFYHEHPRTYSLNSFIYIANSLGLLLNSVDFPSRYGGNIRVFLGGGKLSKKIENQELENILHKESLYGQRLKLMQTQISLWQSKMNSKINELVTKHGALSAKAFPGRAAILVKLLNLDNNSIKCVYEKPGSMKIGHYLPGTKIPILSDEELFSQKNKPEVIINFAWHISAEIKKYLTSNSVNSEIVDILDPNEFRI
jgi:SAM-dependent methyltransferase